MISIFGRNLRDTRGFTIVEMVIVMAILGVVVMAVMSLVIPTKRSSVVQSDLATVQGGMRVVMERITKDFRNAGFLIAGNPVVGYPDPNPGTANPPDQRIIEFSPTAGEELIINTRSVSGIFGRVATAPGGPGDSFTLIYPAQSTHFPVGSYAAVIEPVSGLPVFFSSSRIPAGIYQVRTPDIAGTVKLGTTNGMDDLNADEVGVFTERAAGLVLVRAPSTDPADLNREIRYWLENGVLKRQIDNGNTQSLTLEGSISDLKFIIEEDADGDVHKVSIELEGQSVEAGKDIVGSAKSRRMRAVVSLRNL